MPSKDDCNRALNKLIECKQRRLCDKCNFKIRCTMSNDKFIIKKLIDEHFNPKPYKFEELKPNMWVYDIKYDEFCRIDFIAGIYPHRSYSDGTCEDGAFEENRFFPVQYANLIKMEVKK